MSDQPTEIEKTAAVNAEQANADLEPGQNKGLSVLLVPLIFFVAMVLLLFAGLGKDTTKLDSMLIGKQIPDFEKSLLFDANKMVSNSDVQGPALLNVFASWCPPCYQEHPNLMKLAANNEVKIIGINYRDLREDGQGFINKLGNPYEFIVFDGKGRLGIDLGVYGAPETFLINSQNKIIYRHVGIINDKVWHSKLKPLLFPEAASNEDKDKETAQ